jgi:hypothetical protein
MDKEMKMIMENYRKLERGAKNLQMERVLTENKKLKKVLKESFGDYTKLKEQFSDMASIPDGPIVPGEHAGAWNPGNAEAGANWEQLEPLKLRFDTLGCEGAAPGRKHPDCDMLQTKIAELSGFPGDQEYTPGLERPGFERD